MDLIVSPVGGEAPGEEMGRGGGGDLEGEGGGASGNDGAGVDRNVARLLEDLLDDGGGQGVVDHDVRQNGRHRWSGRSHWPRSERRTV